MASQMMEPSAVRRMSSTYGTTGIKKSGEAAVKSWREKTEGVLWSIEKSEVKVRHLK